MVGGVLFPPSPWFGGVPLVSCHGALALSSPCTRAGCAGTRHPLFSLFLASRLAIIAIITSFSPCFQPFFLSSLASVFLALASGVSLQPRCLLRLLLFLLVPVSLLAVRVALTSSFVVLSHLPRFLVLRRVSGVWVAVLSLLGLLPAFAPLPVAAVCGCRSRLV